MDKQEFLQRYKTEFQMKTPDKHNIKYQDRDIFNAILKNLKRLFADELMPYDIFSSNINTFDKKIIYKHQLYCTDEERDEEIEKKEYDKIKNALDKEQDEIEELILNRRAILLDKIERGKLIHVKVENKGTPDEKFVYDVIRTPDSHINKVAVYDELNKKRERIFDQNNPCEISESISKIDIFEEISEMECEFFILLNRVIPKTKYISKDLKEYRWEVVSYDDRMKILEYAKKLITDDKWRLSVDVYNAIWYKLTYPHKYRYLVAMNRIQRLHVNYERLVEYVEKSKIDDLLERVVEMGNSISKIFEEYNEEENKKFPEEEFDEKAMLAEEILPQIYERFGDDFDDEND